MENDKAINVAVNLFTLLFITGICGACFSIGTFWGFLSLAIISAAFAVLIAKSGSKS